MGFERVWQLREIELLLETDAPASFQLSTDLPDHDITPKFSASVDTSQSTAGRRTVRLRLPGHIKASLFQPRLAPSGTCRLYGARAFGKALGSRTGWAWLDFPVRQTGEAYATAGLPIRQTQEAYSRASLPVRPTQEAYARAELPIRTTPESYKIATLPIFETPPLARWVDLPVDSIE